MLLNSGVGQGIFFAGNKHVAIQIISSPAEARVITTKPEEVLENRDIVQERPKVERLDLSKAPKNESTKWPSFNGTGDAAAAEGTPKTQEK